MDESVIRAMAKWPDVPAVCGWLGLDRRGRWRLRGEIITHRGAVAFIGRNYESDGDGCWYLQNGPQKVFVSLEYTPWVLFSEPGGRLRTHTGLQVESIGRAWIDEEGALVLSTEHGPGVFCDRDLDDALARFRTLDGQHLPEEALEMALQAGLEEDCVRIGFAWRSAIVPVERIRKAELPSRLLFVADPEP